MNQNACSQESSDFYESFVEDTPGGDDCYDDFEIVVDEPTKAEMKECLRNVGKMLENRRRHALSWTWCEEMVRRQVADLLERL